MVAGFEAMWRIGTATHHTNERRGFHAPGTTGPFGGAVAAGHVLGFDAGRMADALGIAGSLAGGLMEFARAGSGGMVKRLHVGRAAESGVLAASLAEGGFAGPHSVIEGEFGFLRVFCEEFDLAEVTRGLGETWATRTLCLKRYACHITAHTPIQAILELRAEHGFAGAEVSGIAVLGSRRMASTNNIPEPADVMMAQYSIPFCVALACHRDPRDPAAFKDGAVDDPAIRALCRAVEMRIEDGRDPRSWASTVEVRLRDGRAFSRTVETFDGTPDRPLDEAGLRDKFLALTRPTYGAAAGALFDRLRRIEDEADLGWLGEVLAPA